VQVLNMCVLEHSQELELKKQELSKTLSDLQQKNEELQKIIQCPYTQTFVYPLTVFKLCPCESCCYTKSIMSLI